MNKDQKSKKQQLESSHNGRNALLPFLIVFLIPVFLYIKTLSFKFTNFDDDHLITDNVTFLSDFKNAPEVFYKEAFIDKSGHFYRPMQTLSYMIDIKLAGGNSTKMYHLTNVLLLGFIACLLYMLLKKFLIPPRLALLSTVVYCAHPLFTSAVAWIPARGDLMLMFFSIISFISLIEYIQQKNSKYLVLHLVAFTIALFCKETAAFLPLLFIVYYVCFHFENRFEKKYLLLIVLYFVSGLFWFWLRSQAIGNYSDPNDLVGFTAFVGSLQVIPEAISQFFIPFGIVEFPVFSSIKTLIGVVIILLIMVVLYKNQERSKKELLFGLAWFLILLLPSLFFKNTQIDYLNHRFFLPLIGIMLFLLFIIPKAWFQKGEIKKPWILVACFIVMSLISIAKMRSYADPITFYTEATSKNSSSSLAFYNMGNIMKNNKGNYNKAIDNYTKAIKIKPDYAEAYNNRGNAYSQLRQYDKAINDYAKAIELKPDFADAYYDRGTAYNNKGSFDEAITDFTKTIALMPDYARAYNNRGFAYFNKLLYDKAINDYTKAIELKADYVKAYNNRANAYQKQGSTEKACSDFKKAAELGSKEAYNSMQKFCK